VPTLTVRPWVDPAADAVGYDPRSDYVEHFWLVLMGPSTTLLLRRLAMALDEWPDGFECSTRELSWSLGLGHSGQNTSLARTFRRSTEFGMTRLDRSGDMLVRRRLPPLPRHMVSRLPAWLQTAHRDYVSPVAAPV
jgi:hypothetical protein